MSKAEDVFGAYAIVVKLDVSNLQNSVQWYENKLGLVHDPRFDTKTWAQLAVPGIARFAIGLNQTANVVNSSGGETTTFTVENISAVRDALIQEGVQVTPISEVDHGVKLAFFNDPDQNMLGLRENPSTQPKPSQIQASVTTA